MVHFNIFTKAFFSIVFSSIILSHSGIRAQTIDKKYDSNGIYLNQRIPANWENLQVPENKSGAGWTSVGPYGGDVLDIAIYSANPDIMIAAAGIPFISYDGGENWEFLETLSNAAPGKKFNSVECLSDGTLIAGGAFISGKAYKSTDGGTSWQSFYFSSAGGVYDIAVSQSNPDIIYMAVSGSASSSTNRLIIKSTDGGDSWTYYNMIDILPVGASAVSVAIDPDNPQTVFFIATSGISDAFVVVSFDGGENWTVTTSNLPSSKPYNVVAIANQKVYVGGGQLFGGNVMGIYESDNWGTSWQNISGSFPNKVVNDILIDPSNSDNMWVATEGDGVYFSADAGANWDFNTTGAGGNGSVRSLIFGYENTDVLFAGFLSLGVCKSEDSGNSWVYSNTGIAALLINDIEIEESNPQRILASFEAENSGGCYLSNDGGESWELVESLPATRFSTVGINTDGTLYAWSNGPSTVAQEGLYMSDDNGQTWQNLGPNLGTYFETEIFALAIPETNPDVIFIGGNNFGVAGWESMIYKSSNGGQTWDNVYQGAEYDSFRYLFIDPGSSGQTVYSAYGNKNQDKGGFLKSIDEGISWNEISNGIPESTKWTSAIVCDPVNPDILYGGIGGYGSTNGSVYKSVDAGANWESTGLSFSVWSKITDLYVSELNPEVVYAASTDHGVYITKTAGEEWFEANEGLPASYVTSFSKAYTTNDTLMILASTYSNSAYKNKVYIPGTTSSKADLSISSKLFVYPNPAKEKCNIRLTLSHPAKVKISIYNSTGEKIRTIENRVINEGSVYYSVSQKAGIYLIKAEVGDKSVTKKIVFE